MFHPIHAAYYYHMITSAVISSQIQDNSEPWNVHTDEWRWWREPRGGDCAKNVIGDNSFQFQRPGHSVTLSVTLDRTCCSIIGIYSNFWA